MRIVVITEFVAPERMGFIGGPDSRETNIFKHLARKHDIHFICARLKGTKEEETKFGIHLHYVGKMREFVQRGSFLQRLNYIKLAIDKTIELKPDVVMGSGFVSYPATYLAGKKLKVPKILTVHEIWKGQWIRNMGFINGIVGSIQEWLYFKLPFDSYIAISEFTREKLLDLGIPNEKIFVIYNGVDLKLLKTIKTKKFKRPTIITVCRLVEYKRVDDIIRATDIIKEKYPNVCLKIIGEGPEEQRLRKLVKELKLEKNVEFLGKIKDYKDLMKTVKASHVFVLASITEGFSVVTIEALALGVPFVVTRIPPLVEVTRGKGGLFFEPKHVGDLVLRILEILDKKAKIKPPGSFIKDYDWKNIAKHEEALLTKQSSLQGKRTQQPCGK